MTLFRTFGMSALLWGVIGVGFSVHRVFLREIEASDYDDITEFRIKAQADAAAVDVDASTRSAAQLELDVMRSVSAGGRVSWWGYQRILAADRGREDAPRLVAENLTVVTARQRAVQSVQASASLVQP